MDERERSMASNDFHWTSCKRGRGAEMKEKCILTFVLAESKLIVLPAEAY